MSDYIFNLAVVLAYTTVPFGLALAAFGVVDASDGHRLRGWTFVVLGALMFLNLFAMTTSGLQAR